MRLYCLKKMSDVDIVKNKKKYRVSIIFGVMSCDYFVKIYFGKHFIILTQFCTFEK